MPTIATEAATYEIDIQVMALMRSELEQGTEVGTFLSVSDGNPVLEFYDDGSSPGVTRPLRQDRYSETLTHVSVPKQLVELGRLHGESYEVTASQGVIRAAFDGHTSVISDIPGSETCETFVSNYSAGEYVITLDVEFLPDEVPDYLYAWYDIIDDTPVLCLDVDSDTAPDSADKRSTTHKPNQGELQVRLPGEIARARTIGGKSITWYRDDDRVYSPLPEPNPPK